MHTHQVRQPVLSHRPRPPHRPAGHCKASFSQQHLKPLQVHVIPCTEGGGVHCSLCMCVALCSCPPLVSSQYCTSWRSSGITKKVLWEGTHSAGGHYEKHWLPHLIACCFLDLIMSPKMWSPT